MNWRRAILCMLGAIALTACAPVAAPAYEPTEGPVEISLERTACFGFCPVYTVTINGEGEVVYQGRAFVNVVGERRATISREAVQQLLARFDEIHFEQLRDEYINHGITDLPSKIVTLTRNGRTKRVVDYAGTSVGMPEAVRALQDEIDRVANTAQWVLRDGQPVREHLPPR